MSRKTTRRNRTSGTDGNGARERQLDRQRRKAVRQARLSVVRSRKQLLAAGRQLASRRAKNRRQAADGEADPDPEAETETEAEATIQRGSTVPETPAGSSVTPPGRLYGTALYRRLTGGDGRERDED